MVFVVKLDKHNTGCMLLNTNAFGPALAQVREKTKRPSKEILDGFFDFLKQSVINETDPVDKSFSIHESNL